MKKIWLTLLLSIAVLSLTVFFTSVYAEPVPDAIFDNVADMQSATLSAGDVVQTRGFYAPNDGGGAIYNIVSTGTPDDYFSFATINNTIAQLYVENDTVNIRQVGAKGDGITDDTQAINAATQSQYGTVYAPTGTYIVTPTAHPTLSSRRVAIVLGNAADNNQSGSTGQAGKNLIGAGQDYTIFKIANNAVQDINGGDLRYDAVISGYTPFLLNVTLSDFTIDQNIQNNPAMPFEGPGTGGNQYKKLYCIKSTLDHATIENIKFYHHGSNAIYVGDTDDRGNDYIIRNCYFEFDMNSSATNTNYDNSCLYCHGRRFTIYNNVITTALDFTTEITDQRNYPNTYTTQLYGVGGIEIHGVDAEVSYNQINKYYIGIHYRTQDDSLENANNDSRVHHNTISNTSIGVSFGNDAPTLQTVSGALFDNNTINISFAYKKGFRDSILTPCGFRTVSNQPNDTRLNFNGVQFDSNTVNYDLSTRIAGYSYIFDVHAGIILRSDYLQNITVTDNTIANAPGVGVEVNRHFENSITNNYTVSGNEFINCGWSDSFNVDFESMIARRAAIKISPAVGSYGSVTNVTISNNIIRDTSENGQCLYAINVPKSLVSNGSVVLLNNTEYSTSGKGFFVPPFSSVTDQIYPRIPSVLNYSLFPENGTFYKDQEINITDGQNIESTWVITKSGTIGKSIPGESETGTVSSSGLIVMDYSDHNIQSGDIINVRNANGQSQQNVWVRGVTDKLIYVDSISLTGDIIVSFSEATWKQIHTNKDIETIFSAVPEKPIVVVNEYFFVTVTTHKDVSNVKIKNENDTVIAVSEQSAFTIGESKVWNLKIRFGSAATNRTIKVYGALEGLDYSIIYETFTISVVSGTVPTDIKPVIYVKTEGNSFFINELFLVTVVTDSDVSNIKILNENNMNITMYDKSSTITGDHKIWSAKIKFGSAGLNRTARVFATYDNVNYNANYKAFSFDIVSGTPPYDLVTVLSAVPDQNPVYTNTEFYITVTTLDSVDRIKILNENGAQITPVYSDYTVSGDYKVWSVSIELRRTGNRTLYVYGAVNSSEYPDTYEEVNVNVLEL